MSKASDWAGRMQAAQREAQAILLAARPCPYFRVRTEIGHSIVVAVGDTGDLEIRDMELDKPSKTIVLSPVEALMMALWVHAMYTEDL